MHKSTVSREINERSVPNGYFADIAQLDYESKRENCGKSKILSDNQKRNYVIDKLHKEWSPETISGRLRLENASWSINHETIYQFVYEDDYCKREVFYQYLRQGKKKRTKWRGRKYKKSRIPNRVSIHQRPAVVSYKVQFGHWEGDSIIYPNKKAINTLNELKTGYLEFSLLERKTADLTAEAIISP